MPKDFEIYTSDIEIKIDPVVGLHYKSICTSVNLATCLLYYKFTNFYFWPPVKKISELMYSTGVT